MSRNDLFRALMLSILAILCLGQSCPMQTETEEVVDAAIVTIDPGGITVTPLTGLLTSEEGSTAEFTVVLDRQPVSDVRIRVASRNVLEGTVSPAVLTFTPDNWSKPQVVRVTGEDDTLYDGDVAFTVVTDPAMSADPGYQNLDAPDLWVTNRDNDVDGGDVTPPAGQIIIEPDDYPGGTVLTHINDAFTLSTTVDDNSIVELFEVTASEDGLDLEPTGERVFGHADIPFFNDDRRLRIDFNKPAKEIQIAFAGGTFFETEVGVLQAFDAGNNLVAEYITSPRGAGKPEIMKITRTTADIAWAVAYSQGPFGRLDRLIVTVATE